MRALGELLALARWSPSVQKQVSAALMAVSVEKEAKVLVVQHAGRSLVDMLRVGWGSGLGGSQKVG